MDPSSTSPAVPDSRLSKMNTTPAMEATAFTTPRKNCFKMPPDVAQYSATPQHDAAPISHRIPKSVDLDTTLQLLVTAAVSRCNCSMRRVQWVVHLAL